MSIVSIVLLFLVFLIFIIGIIGIVLPVIPSLPVIWIGIFIYAIFTNFDQVTWITIFVTGVLMIIGIVVDALAGLFGARAYGASWFGVIGAMLGGIIGFFIINLLGMFLGSFVGAFLGEFIRYRRVHHSLKAGFGTIVGFVLGVSIKIFMAFLMIGIFFGALFF